MAPWAIAEGPPLYVMWCSPSDWCGCVLGRCAGGNGNHPTAAWLSQAALLQGSTAAEVARCREDEEPNRPDPTHVWDGTVGVPRNSLEIPWGADNLQQSGHWTMLKTKKEVTSYLVILDWWHLGFMYYKMTIIGSETASFFLIEVQLIYNIILVSGV